MQLDHLLQDMPSRHNLSCSCCCSWSAVLTVTCKVGERNGPNGWNFHSCWSPLFGPFGESNTNAPFWNPTKSLGGSTFGDPPANRSCSASAETPMSRFNSAKSSFPRSLSTWLPRGLSFNRFLHDGSKNDSSQRISEVESCEKSCVLSANI